jgi:hypothetical protein
MAFARCETCGAPQRLKNNYLHFHTLLYSVNIKILCGARCCARRGFIWLTDEEERQYLDGQRDVLNSKPPFSGACDMTCFPSHNSNCTV